MCNITKFKLRKDLKMSEVPQIVPHISFSLDKFLIFVILFSGGKFVSKDGREPNY